MCKDTKIISKYCNLSPKAQDNIQNIYVIFIFVTFYVVLRDVFYAIFPMGMQPHTITLLLHDVVHELYLLSQFAILDMAPDLRVS